MNASAARRRVEIFLEKPFFFPVFLFLLTAVAYGLFIPWLHVYIDDWLLTWTWEKLGPAGLEEFFRLYRPVWGWIYQVTMPVLYPHIIAYHIFALVTRWASAVTCWWFLRVLWPGRAQAAAVGATVFLLYPGFALQPIAISYSHLFLVYIFFLLSLGLNLVAMKNQAWYWLFTGLAVLFSLVNLLSVEFFFTLEAARVFFIFFALGPALKSLKERVRRTALHWSPYLAALVAGAVYRSFVFRYQNLRYQFQLIDTVKSSPLEAARDLVVTIITDLGHVTFGAWLPALERLADLKPTHATTLLTGFVVFAVLLLVFLHNFLRKNAGEPADSRWSLQVILLGVFTLLAAGWPFWLTGLDIQVLDFKSRFTLPFILGVSILAAGLVPLVRPSWARALIFAVVVSAASGYHVQIANDFRLNWNGSQQLFWQLAWRAPDIQEGTLLLLTDVPFLYYNEVTYATHVTSLYPKPGDHEILPYFVLNVRELNERTEGGIRSGVPITNRNNITARYTGSTSQALMLQYDLGQCLRILDAEFDIFDKSLSVPEMNGSKVSNLAFIKAASNNQPDMRWFGKEPPHTWCYYFEKAELARQRGDWQQAADYGDEAANKGFTARDEMEKLVFIEAYARTDQWEKALGMSEGFRDDEKKPMLCLLWQRIDQETPPGNAKSLAFQQLLEENICIGNAP